MELIFIRHGETDFNKHHRVMGQRFDLELDETGLGQAKEVIAKLPASFKAIYSSPLKRASQTAQAIGDHFGMKVDLRSQLMERDFGNLSGKTWHEMELETGLPMNERDNNLVYDYTPYGGESADSVKTRLTVFLDEMKQLHPHDTVVVVTHFGIISMMNSMYPHKEHHKLTNTSIHKFEMPV